MIDINERAVELAQRKRAANGVTNRWCCKAICSTASRPNVRCDYNESADPRGKEVVHRIFEEGAGLLEPGGSIWVVIQKKQGAPSAGAKLEAFRQVEEVTKEKGYRIFRAELKEQ